jgi:hypothetical protein
MVALPQVAAAKPLGAQEPVNCFVPFICHLLTLIGDPLPPVSNPVTLVSGPVTLVSGPVTLVSG